jgi:photosystem II stability/assembly factor-like uncharacterized protein
VSSFDTIDHGWLLRFLEHRIGDPRLLRLVQKWLRAGVLENGKRTKTEAGTPQGATVSPLLANVYLHDALDVWFENESHGFVVGAYNLILETTDGGRTWQSWFDRVTNPRFMTLYSIRPAAGGLFIAGEAGVVFRLDPVAKHFDAVPVDYAGSLFGVADAGDAVLVFGLRGNAFRSSDGGATWTKVDSRLPATIVGGTTLERSAVVLADQGGRLAISYDGCVNFELVPVQRTLPLTSVVDAGAGRLAVTGPFGVMVVAPESTR